MTLTSFLVGPQVTRTGAQFGGTAISYSGVESGFGQYCVDMKLSSGATSGTSSSLRYVGGTIEPLNEDNVAVELREICVVDGEATTNVYPLPASVLTKPRWVVAFCFSQTNNTHQSQKQTCDNVLHV